MIYQLISLPQDSAIEKTQNIHKSYFMRLLCKNTSGKRYSGFITIALQK